MRDRIKFQPEDAGNYVILAEAWLWLGRKKLAKGVTEAAIKILEEAKNYPVVDGCDWDLDRRLEDLKIGSSSKRQFRSGAVETITICSASEAENGLEL